MFPESIQFFALGTRGINGFRANCRECSRAYARKRYWSDPEKQRIAAREYNATITPEQRIERNERDREWRKNNPDKVKASKKRDYEKNKLKRKVTMRKNYEKNKPVYIERGKKWKKANPEKVKVNTLKRIIRKRSLPMSYSPKDWITALEYFNHQCAICGYDCSNPNDNRVLAQDHWIPMEYKGIDNPGTVPTNIVPLCHGTDGCNNLKHDFMPDVYLNKCFGYTVACEIQKKITDYFDWIRTR